MRLDFSFWLKPGHGDISHEIANRALRDRVPEITCAPFSAFESAVAAPSFSIKILLAGFAAEYEFRGLPLNVRGAAGHPDHIELIEMPAIARVRRAFERCGPGGLQALATEVVTE